MFYILYGVECRVWMGFRGFGHKAVRRKPVCDALTGGSDVLETICRRLFILPFPPSPLSPVILSSRTWSTHEHIPLHLPSQALQLLSVLAAARLDSDSYDHIEEALLGLLGDESGNTSAAAAAADDASILPPGSKGGASLAGSHWEEVPIPRSPARLG